MRPNTADVLRRARLSRALHACWVSAIVLWVATPDGQGGVKRVSADGGTYQVFVAPGSR